MFARFVCIILLAVFIFRDTLWWSPYLVIIHDSSQNSIRPHWPLRRTKTSKPDCFKDCCYAKFNKICFKWQVSSTTKKSCQRILMSPTVWTKRVRRESPWDASAFAALGRCMPFRERRIGANTQRWGTTPAGKKLRLAPNLGESWVWKDPKLNIMLKEWSKLVKHIATNWNSFVQVWANWFFKPWMNDS